MNTLPNDILDIIYMKKHNLEMECIKIELNEYMKRKYRKTCMALLCYLDKEIKHLDVYLYCMYTIFIWCSFYNDGIYKNSELLNKCEQMNGNTTIKLKMKMDHGDDLKVLIDFYMNHAIHSNFKPEHMLCFLEPYLEEALSLSNILF